MTPYLRQAKRQEIAANPYFVCGISVMLRLCKY